MPGQAAACPTAARLLERLRPGAILLADKAYGADWLRRRIERAGAAPNIPFKSNRVWKNCFSPALYRERNRVERFFNRIKHVRRIATRYEKHASNYHDTLKLACIKIWMRVYESMA
jgi:transposase